MTPAGTIGSALRDAEERIRRAGIEAPRIQARTLLAHALDCDLAGLLARLRERIDPPVAARFRALVDLRVARHPLQYLVGSAHFLDFRVAVGPGVFIPRPETELLVERALEAWSPEHPWAVDLCTGSGAVAIALARARPRARVLAIDVAASAVAATRANARELGVADRVRLVRGDLLTSLQAGPWWRHVGVLACNPPYAPKDDVVQPEVRDHEPALAWSPGPRGTEIYERLIPAAADLLPPGRPLVLELGYGQDAAVTALLAADARWQPPRIDPDFQGIPRVLTTVRA